MKKFIGFSLIALIGVVIIPSKAIAVKYHLAINNIHLIPESEDLFTGDTVLLRNANTSTENESNSPTTYRVINGVTVPADFPEITTEQTGETAPGLIFYATHDYKRKYFIITNNAGEIYYYLKSDEGDFGNPTVQPNNLLTLYSYYDGYYVFDSTFTIIDTISQYVNSHELLLLENGHRLSFRAGSGIIYEFDADDNLIFKYHSIDSLLGGERPHTNSIDVDYDGHLIVSSRDYNEVVKINRNTGEIMWHLGGAYDSFSYINEELRLSWQHDARAIKGFPNHYLIYDNGTMRDTGLVQTRVVEYKIDTTNMTAEKVWEFSDSVYNSSIMGCSQRFENGNTFIDFIYPYTSAFEVNPAGEVIFKMNTNTTPHYRCRRYNWYGKMKHPLLNLHDMQGAVHLIFHQFGDSTINYYKIYYGLDKNNLHVKDSTANTNYFIYNLQNNSMYYFGVTSVNNEGVESEMSEIKHQLVLNSGPLENIIRNGDFNERGESWFFNLKDSAEARFEGHENYGEVEITNPGNTLSDITLTQDYITLLNGKKYVFEFDAYATNDRIIEAEISKATSPFTNYSRIGKTYITTEKQHFVYEFVMEELTDVNAILIFNLGEYSGDVIIDNISLKYLDDNIDPNLSCYAKINFHIPGGDFPIKYSSDIGSVYGKRGNGLYYGWLSENNNTVILDTMVDIRYQSFNYLKKDNVEYTWEIEIPNGAITAKIGMGDPSSTSQINDIYVEDTLFPDTDGEDNYDEIYVKDIEVIDGKFSIKPGPNAVNAKIAYIEIYYNKPVVSGSSKVTGITRNYDINIYPVPASETINIQLTLAHRNNVEIELTDIMGRTIDKHSLTMFEVGKHEVEFDISSLPPSVYIIKTSIDGKKVNRKIIVQ